VCIALGNSSNPALEIRFVSGNYFRSSAYSLMPGVCFVLTTTAKALLQQR